MNSELTKMILELVFSFLGLVISTVGIWAIKTYVFPWLKTKLGDATFDSLLERISTFMSAAEEKFSQSEGEAKSAWVISQIQDIFPKLDKDYIQSLIDGLMKPLEKEGIINQGKAA